MDILNSSGFKIGVAKIDGDLIHLMEKLFQMNEKQKLVPRQEAEKLPLMKELQKLRIKFLKVY